MSTPSFCAQIGSKDCSASIHAHNFPSFCASPIICKQNDDLPADLLPQTKTCLPYAKPPLSALFKLGLGVFCFVISTSVALLNLFLRLGSSCERNSSVDIPCILLSILLTIYYLSEYFCSIFCYLKSHFLCLTWLTLHKSL